MVGTALLTTGVAIYAQTVTIPDFDLIGIAAILIAIGVIWGVAVKGNRFLKKANRFFDDWYGTEESPGVLHRISDLEDNQRAIKGQIDSINETVQTQLARNNGTTVADAAFEALRVVQEVQLQVEEEVQARKAWHEQYETDQQNSRREWTQVFMAIRKMIPIEDSQRQLELWDDITERYTKGEL